MKKQNFAWKNMTVGTCYYPEHCPENLWESDLDRMLSVGISTIRIAEFAWSKVELHEGEFDYSFFDRFLELCKEKGMKVIFGTPSATPPAWLTEKYPEVLNCNIDGVLYRHGARRHYNYNSPKYRELVSIITEKIAAHYANHPAIIGWQIDNELNCETEYFYSEADSAAFRVYLREKYGSLDNLNRDLGTTFWNETYTAWDEIFVPRTVLNKGYNPHFMLEYYRFISHSAISFCKMQADIIRKYVKDGDFITTNGMFWNLDNHKMTEECLDVYTYDSYPNFAYSLDSDPINSTNLNDRHWSKNLTEVRSICPHFGIMEQQSGANGWATRMEAAAPRPGQLRLWAMQSVAHGADFISFFRWRTCAMGTEIYWHGILDYDNRDNRKLAEVKRFAEDFRKLDAICGAKNTAAFGLLKDYDNAWDTNIDNWHNRVLSVSEENIFEAAQLNHTPYDAVYLRENTELKEFAAYPVLIYPHPSIVTEERAKLLEEYVNQGGTLIIGCRSGYKDINGKCVMLPQPGLLQKITGSDVRDFTFASPAEDDITANFGGTELKMPVFNDVLSVAEGFDDVNIPATYSNGYFAGAAAITERAYGKGKAIHLGSTFTRENVKALLEHCGVLKPMADFIEAPEEIELVLREKDSRKFIFALNYMPESKNIELKVSATALIKGEEIQGKLSLEPYGVEVFEIM